MYTKLRFLYSYREYVATVTSVFDLLSSMSHFSGAWKLSCWLVFRHQYSHYAKRKPQNSANSADCHKQLALIGCSLSSNLPAAAMRHVASRPFRDRERARKRFLSAAARTFVDAHCRNSWQLRVRVHAYFTTRKPSYGQVWIECRKLEFSGTLTSVEVVGGWRVGLYGTWYLDESSLERLYIYVYACMYVCTHKESWLSSMRWGVVCPLLGRG